MCTRTITVILLLISPVVLFSAAQAVLAEEQDDVRSIAGMSYVPKAHWSFPSIFNNMESDEIEYDMDATSYTSYDANVRIKYIEASLGVNAVLKDGPAGEVDQLVGYIGIKRIAIRYAQGKIKGTAEWNGSLAPGMAASFQYDNALKNYDILYLFKEDSQKNGLPNPGWYVGIGYTTFEAPVEIQTLVTPGGKENQVFGVPVYDKKYSIKAYSALFGFDTLSGALIKGTLKPGEINFFGTAYDRLGFGSGRISEESVQFAEALNPGKTFVDRKGVVAYLENDSTLGMYWSPSLFSGHGVVALGYNLAFEFAVPFGGAAESPDDLGYEASFSMLRHGPQVRVYAGW